MQMFPDTAAAFEMKYAVDLGIRRETQGVKKAKNNNLLPSRFQEFICSPSDHIHLGD